jgi:hypothetical protein
LSFNIDDYVDVAERIRIFRDKHPDGALQSSVELVKTPEGFVQGVLCKAWAYRGVDDTIPGIGHSFMQVPGRTPYTKDSEVENAETSAWGRAIVAALAADTKKVASADEVRARQGSAPADGNRQSAVQGAGSGASGDSRAPAPAPTTGDGWTWPFGKHKGKTLAETDPGYLEWFLANSDKEDIKERVRAFQIGGELEAVGAVPVGGDDDISF